MLLLKKLDITKRMYDVFFNYSYIEKTNKGKNFTKNFILFLLFTQNVFSIFTFCWNKKVSISQKTNFPQDNAKIRISTKVRTVITLTSDETELAKLCKSFSDDSKYIFRYSSAAI